MKKSIILICVSVIASMSFFASCSEDELGPTIYDPKVVPLDRTQYTFPLDSFLEANYREVYNIRYLYKLVDISADMDYNLTPCSYQKSKEIAVLAKYLWFDVYGKLKSPEFLKEYAPRILHIIGSAAYNPSSGTMTLGEAKGGKKITFYRGNSMDVYDIADANEKFFKTLHHEFAHILHQTKVMPTEFGTLSLGQYDPLKWQNRNDSVVLSQGFVSTYASSEYPEDWVETIANYIVKDSITWEGMLNTAAYGWEVLRVKVEDFDPELETRTYDDDLKNPSGKIVEYSVLRKTISRDADGKPVLVDGEYQYLDNDGVDGKAMILRKLDMCRTWLKESFSIDLDQLRKEVQLRQYLTDENGNFVIQDREFVNRMTSPLHPGSSETLMDSLLHQVDKFKELQP